MSPAIKAMFYLRLLSLKNWLFGRIKRLRKPKYLIGFIIGGFYFWVVFFRHLGGSPLQGGRVGGPSFFANPAGFIFIAVISIAVLRILGAWLAPDPNPALPFTESEIAFLFPAPISRRTLIHFKLLGGQIAILISSLFLSLIQNRGGAFGGNALFHAVGWWSMLSMISLHTMGASFTVARLVDGGVSRLRRRASVVAVVLLLVAAAGVGAWKTMVAIGLDPALSGAGGRVLASEMVGRAKEIASTGIQGWLLLPVRLVLGPFFAAGWLEFLGAMVPALAIIGVHYVWVMKSETSFEEASIAFAEKRAKAIAAIRSGNFRPGMGKTKARKDPFKLASSGGRPEIAFLWKNLLSTRPYFNHRVFLVSASIIVVAGSLVARSGDGPQTAYGVVAMVALVISAYIMLAGPQFARQDLRSDLANADLLKTYPLPGWQVALGEILTPVSILTGIVWLAILIASIGAQWIGDGPGELPLGIRIGGAACLAIIVPLVITLQLIIPNAGTVIFPSWAQVGPQRDRGIEVVGQRMIFVFGQMLMTILALVPAGLCGFLLWFAAHWVMGPVGSTVVAGTGVVLILLVEIVCGLLWLGGRFEKLDISSEQLK